MNRTDIENKIDELKRQRGLAVLAGKPFDSSAIAKAQAELDAFVDAEGARAA